MLFRSLFLGDGESCLNPLSDADRAALAADMASHQVAFFAVPLAVFLPLTILLWSRCPLSLARLRAAELVLVAGAPHDALNDATHRSVAAAVVQWLERLRAGAPYSTIIEHG